VEKKKGQKRAPGDFITDKRIWFWEAFWKSGAKGVNSKDGVNEGDTSATGGEAGMAQLE